MKYVERSDRRKIGATDTFVASIAAAKVIRQPFSEADIFELHDMFLTNGFHFFKAPTIEQGRSIVYTLLDSLDYYHNIGCLSLNTQPVSTVTNINNVLLDTTISWTKEFLAEYLLEIFFFDFFWIEATSTLIQYEMFDLFQETLTDLNLDRTSPIIVIV